MKNIFKRLFCHHEYEEDCRVAIVDFFGKESLDNIDYVCVKCKKRIEIKFAKKA